MQPRQSGSTSLSGSSWLRPLVGFALGPAGALVVYAVLLTFDPFEAGSSASKFWFLVVVLIVSYVGELVIALPLYVASRSFGLSGPKVWVPGGSLVGVFLMVMADVPQIRWSSLIPLRCSCRCWGVVRRRVFTGYGVAAFNSVAKNSVAS